MARADNINPGILTWARETAGLSLEDAAARIGIGASAALSAAEKLDQLERGAKFPTRIQLTRFASVYRRPLLTFYMQRPPPQVPRGEDFRTLPFEVPPHENALLDALLRDIRARQDMVKSILEDDEDRKPLDFVGSVAMPRGVQFVVDSIAARLGFQPNAHRKGTTENLFKDLRCRAERAGIFVLLVGDLGSHHSVINERVFRGFAIADQIAPFVVINDQDARTARSFTLIHELAHIWLGQTGVSGLANDGQATTPQGRIEQFCNDVAGHLLLPADAFADRPDFSADDIQAAANVIDGIAKIWRVSEPMVTYRMSRLGWITGKVYGHLTAHFSARWQAMRLRQTEEAKDRDSKPSYYTVRQFKLGDALLGVVHNAMRSNQLTHTKAAKVLGVNPSSVEPLLKKYESSRGAFIPESRR
jgi:Zn-dependent peptidase ImmA (M78 family)/transcriptional regulator with XRE-family HTH domain